MSEKKELSASSKVRKTESMKKRFLENNMKRTFMPRPSVPYLEFTDMDTVKDKQLEPLIVNGLGHILSVNGFSVSSNFVINLTIRIRGSGGLLEKKMHEYSTDFPIYIRSKPLRKERVADVEQLGLLPNSLKTNFKNLKTHFQFIHESPIMLPGCATAYD